MLLFSEIVDQGCSDPKTGGQEQKNDEAKQQKLRLAVDVIDHCVYQHCDHEEQCGDLSAFGFHASFLLARFPKGDRKSISAGSGSVKETPSFREFFAKYEVELCGTL